MTAAPIPFPLMPYSGPAQFQAPPMPVAPSDLEQRQVTEPLPSPATPPTVAMVFSAEDVELAINELRRVIGPRTENAMGIGRLSLRANIKYELMEAAVMHLHFYAEIRRRYSDDKLTYLYFAAQRLKQAGPPRVIPERLMRFPMPHTPRTY